MAYYKMDQIQQKKYSFNHILRSLKLTKELRSNKYYIIRRTSKLTMTNLKKIFFNYKKNKNIHFMRLNQKTEIKVNK